MNAKHSSVTDEWYTPVDHIERARRVLGTIDFDPASDAFGNSRVGALRYATKEHSVLGQTCWCELSAITVFMNPPGGKIANESLPGLFWKNLMEIRALGCLRHAIVACFSIESFQVAQNYGVPPPQSFPFCVPKKRTKWERESGIATSPTHANAYVYVPGTLDVREEFFAEFSDLGFVRM